MFQISRHPVLMIFLNGTSVVQIFVMLSNFLLGYNLLLYTKSNTFSFRLLPYITVKRIARYEVEINVIRRVVHKSDDRWRGPKKTDE